MTKTSDDADEIEPVKRFERDSSETDDADASNAQNAVDSGDFDSESRRNPRDTSCSSTGSSDADPSIDSQLEDRDGASPERRLEETLGRIDVSTTSEGYVEGRVTGLEPVDETTVRLTVALPHDETVSFALEKPIPWSTEFLLARIVDDVGYDAASISHLVGERVSVTRADLERESPAATADDGWDWIRTSARVAGDTLLSSIGSQFRLEERRQPEWRLVDPRERRGPTDDASVRSDPATLGAILIVLAPLVAAGGVAYGLAGGLGTAVSVPAVGAVLLALLLALIGLSAFVTGDS